MQTDIYTVSPARLTSQAKGNEYTNKFLGRTAIHTRFNGDRIPVTIIGVWNMNLIGWTESGKWAQLGSRVEIVR